ncbi:MAG: hydroxymethylbilane synthase [Candidatus Nanopelagicales bacterium]
MNTRTPRTLRVATRRSDLAMAQSRMIGEWLSVLTGRPLEIVEITTKGDVDPAPLSQIGGTGVFVAAVRQALLERRADIAVHSLKDLPTAPDERLYLAAVPRRVDPRDALVARDAAALADLPVGARVGTGSPRRRAQLAAARPDLELVDIRGNVDTRLARVTQDLDAVVLAVAGLTRLGRGEQISAHLEPESMLPAPGQGALAVEVHADLRPDPATGQGADPPLTLALATLDHADTRAAVLAERSLLATLGAGCSAPVGALAEVGDPEVDDDLNHAEVSGAVARGGRVRSLRLRAVLARADGVLVHAESSAPLHEAEALGARLAHQLLAQQLLTDPPDPMHSTRPRSTHRGSRQ